MKILFDQGTPVSLRWHLEEHTVQKLRKRQIAIVVLLSTSWPRIRPRVDNIREVINAVSAGDYAEILI